MVVGGTRKVKVKDYRYLKFLCYGIESENVVMIRCSEQGVESHWL